LLYTLIRSHRRKKTLSIHVKGNGEVVIQVPEHTSQADIDRFFQEKRQWVLKTLGRQHTRNHDRHVRTFVPGEWFPYLGLSYPLVMRERDDPGDLLTFTGHEFLLGRHALRTARVLFLLWYQKQARTHLEERVHHFGERLGMAPAGVLVGNTQSRWGSCSPENYLRFAWRLIMAPAEIIDYVVVHELCHLKIRNHSHDYWRLVEQIIADYRKRRTWLRDYGHRLTL
jgi:hypothetical protein